MNNVKFMNYLSETGYTINKLFPCVVSRRYDVIKNVRNRKITGEEFNSATVTVENLTKLHNDLVMLARYMDNHANQWTDDEFEVRNGVVEDIENVANIMEKFK